jgi:G3E family GTPase
MESPHKKLRDMIGLIEEADNLAAVVGAGGAVIDDSNDDIGINGQKNVEDDDEEIPFLVEVPSERTSKVPVTILTGFLGAGKTTLLRYLLTASHGKRIAIIENEFSLGMGIEGMIAMSGVDGADMSNFFELNNGCICCTVKDNLLSTLEQLVLHKDRFDYIIIETTGVANPGPVISVFWADEGLESSLKLDGVVTVVDGINIEKYLSDENTKLDVSQQICYADRILLNKSDLIGDETRVCSLISRTALHF